MDENNMEEKEIIEKKDDLNQAIEKNFQLEKNMKIGGEKILYGFCLLIITLIIPLILTIISPGSDDFLRRYLIFLSVIVYIEGIFLFFIKKILPWINWIEIRFFLSIVIGSYIICNARPGSSDGLLFYIFEFGYIPLICVVGYFFSRFIEKLLLFIHSIKEGKKFTINDIFSKDGIVIIVLLIIYLIFSLFNKEYLRYIGLIPIILVVYYILVNFTKKVLLLVNQIRKKEKITAVSKGEIILIVLIILAIILSIF